MKNVVLLLLLAAANTANAKVGYASLEQREDILLQKELDDSLAFHQKRIMEIEVEKNGRNLNTATHLDNMATVAYLASKKGRIDIVGSYTASFCPPGDHECVNAAYKAAKDVVRGKVKKTDDAHAAEYQQLYDDALAQINLSGGYESLSQIGSNRRLQGFGFTGAATLIATLFTIMFSASGPNVDDSADPSDPDLTFFQELLISLTPSTLYTGAAPLDGVYLYLIAPFALQLLQYIICMIFLNICWWAGATPVMPCQLTPSYCTSRDI